MRTSVTLSLGYVAVYVALVGCSTLIRISRTGARRISRTGASCSLWLRLGAR